MSDNKLIDLHKVAGLFREIQTEEFAKDEAKQESEFKKTMKEMEQGVEEEISEELTAAQKKLPAGLRDAIAKKQGDSADDKEADDKEETKEETKEEYDPMSGMDEPTPKEGDVLDHDELGKIQVLKVTATDINGQPAEYLVQTSNGNKTLHHDEVLSQVPQGTYDEAVTEEEKQYAVWIAGSKVHKGSVSHDEAEKIVQKYRDSGKWTEKAFEIRTEEVNEEPVAENPEMVAMDTNTLQQILNLAGLKPVTDSDINQPEADAEPVEEYSNSPDEEYADADTQLNKMSGGPNRPKATPAVGNQGHNDLVTKLKKAYDSRDL